VDRFKTAFTLAVTSLFQSENAIELLGACRQQNDRNGGVLPNLGEDRETVKPREHHIKDYQMWRGPADGSERLQTGGSFGDLETLATQIRRQHFAHHRLVIDDHNPLAENGIW
jgi:hypothetical protein